NLIGMLAVLSFAIQRLHDLGYSAWTATIFFIPALGIPVISLLAVPVSMIIGLILLFARGVAQPNKYGPPPAGHKKNKLLIFIAVLIVTFMLYSSHFQEAKPVIDPIIQNILNVQ
ncbi:MAG: DUF805 domain-containing protein, partial [Gammaproteobacteria bacterium]|nr:DUF805 domain-containing protein [Gammaproteobacteria bacterium]